MCVQEGTFGKVTGWGVTRFMGHSSRFLRQVTLPVVTQAKCRASTDQVSSSPEPLAPPTLPPLTRCCLQVVTDNMFCAGHLEAGPDACKGDSGGPFTVHYRDTWFLVGVVSWGDRCGAQGEYGFYTRLGNFLAWMNEIMETKVPLEPLETMEKTEPVRTMKNLEIMETLSNTTHLEDH